jgi:hypothetical protein
MEVKREKVGHRYRQRQLMSRIARLAFVPIGISIVDACTVVDTIKTQNMIGNTRILGPLK